MYLRIQKLELDDMDRAALILRESFDARLPDLAGLHTPEEDRHYFRNHVFATAAVWGAVDRNDIVGILTLRGEWIDHLYVLPAHQGKGAGHALLNFAKTTSPVLQLWTFQQNTLARAFYEKNGFTAIEETDGSRNEERAPDILYRWEIG